MSALTGQCRTDCGVEATRLLCWSRRAVKLVAFTVLLIVGGTAANVWWTARQDSRPTSDVIIVLGAAQFDGRPSTIFKARLQHARKLHDQGVAPVVLTVGGGLPGDRTTEAAAGAQFLAERGVTAVPVPHGNDTYESLIAARALMVERGWSSAVLVTDPWHALRSVRMARDSGMVAVSSPTRAGPSVRTRQTQLRYIARETLAVLYYELAGGHGVGGPSAL